MLLREEDAVVHGCSAGVVLAEARQRQVHGDAPYPIAVAALINELVADVAITLSVETRAFDLDAKVEHIFEQQGCEIVVEPNDVHAIHLF